MTRPTTIWIQTDAPRKPALGAPCNGCGVCCLAEPCPLGVWLSRRRHGACAALRWDHAVQSYRCGPLARWLAAEATASQAWTGLRGPRRWWAWLRWGWARLAVRWTVRQIGAGAGCDSDAEVAPASGLGADAPREAGQAMDGAGRPVP